MSNDELLDPEIELHQDPNLPGTAGSFHGQQGALAMMAEIDEAWDSQQWEPVDLGHLITTRDGLTTRLDAFRDWDAARRVGGLAE